ncbi:maternal effect protein staufen [Scaptodrosophila lebanonensis]|uniref:Maternal effect protein staufen n=1 Tax=Drosophila lebanonensis TaxID=7225 RepID=A0A6J2T3W6_DROLE|nr:maternal effect protein staufen [Scaptodrosophila lebanonensis]
MQHHVHSARQTPHVRAAHHHNHIPLHPAMAPALTQDQQLMASLPPTAPGASAATVALGAPQQQQTQREHHHARLSHHHHHTQPANASTATYHHNTNQMQKIRQQHQHLNTNNGHVKCNQPAPQTYNHMAANAAALSYNQAPPYMTAHLGGYAAQPQPIMGGKPPHYYINNATKPSKYNNNISHYNANSVNNSFTHAPKTILQNTYRNAKTNGQTVPASDVVVAATELLPLATTSNSNNIVITPDDNAAGEFVEKTTTTTTSLEATDTAAASALQTPNEDNISSSSEHIDAAGNLPNEDNSTSRSSKDKTPMCLVNELARYNKITHQYRLTGERGPAHCKTFTVTLKLGEEEYSADGFKIKKAQHLAASKAIEETTYKHPPPKVRRNDEINPSRTHITPTVELNALAMKLGQRTYYLLDPTQVPPSDTMLTTDSYGASLLPTPPSAGLVQASGPPPSNHVPYAMRRNGNYMVPAPPIHPHLALQPHRGIYGHQRTFTPKYPARYALPPPLGGHMMHGPHGPFAPLPVTPSKITLFVGKQKFVGIGRTLQQAKHDAAARALQVLKAQANSSTEEALDDSMDEGDKKSPISQVHEIGIKRNMTVHFKVLREEGPAHMKNFITACIVGSIVTEGEGNGKKISKKRAAEKMLTELQKLPPLTPTKQTPMKRIKVKTPGKGAAAAASNGQGATAATPPAKGERRKRASNTTKEKTVELDDAENPITKLIQLQQNRKEKEPIFELVAKNGNESSRRREFVIEVSANGNTARGTGNSKKLAKRNAAQALLELLENTENVPSSEAEHVIENDSAAAVAPLPAIESVAGLDVPMVSTPAGPVPGILILRQNKKAKKKDISAIVKNNVELKEEAIVEATTAKTATSTIAIADESKDNTNNESNPPEATTESVLNTSTGSNTSGVSSNSSNATGSSNGKNNSSNAGNSCSSTSGNSGGAVGGGVHMKEQLLYLSKLLDFEVNFSDYPKGNHNEFLTIVTLSTEPPQICHGVGKSSDESQNDAARNALKILSELGLNNAKK